MITQIFKTMPKLKDGEPLPIRKSGKEAVFVHKCCDCGLRHDVKITIGSRNVVLRFWRIIEQKRRSK